jgi:hypothetical protein
MAGYLMRPERTSPGSGPGVSAAVSVTPFAFVAGRADCGAAGSALASSSGLAALPLDLPPLALGLSALSPLPDFLSALGGVAVGAVAWAVPVAVVFAGAAFAAGALVAGARAAGFLAPAAADALDRAGSPDRVGAALVTGFVAVDLGVAVFDTAGFAGVVARALAASFSDVTAVSRALAAVEIAVSALVSVFADVAALVAAAFSLVDAELTRVAAEDTVRGVTAAARAAADVLRAADLVVPLAPAAFAVPAGFAGPAGLAELVAFVALAGRVARAPVPARTEPAIRTGAAFLSAAFFVGGTDLPPIWIT